MAASRIGFSYLDLPPWNEDRWRGLEALLELQWPDLVSRAEIEHQVSLYLCRAGGRLGDRPLRVRTRALKDRLRKIATIADDLAERLKFDGSTDQEREEGRFARARLVEHAGLARGLEALPAILKALAAGARAAVGPPQEGGRPEDKPFDYLVWRLADLFERVTQKRATVDRRDRAHQRVHQDDQYHGAFFDVMCAIADGLPGRMHVNTFGEKIRRALDRRSDLVRQGSYRPLTR
jgi:hypothetical protein